MLKCGMNQCMCVEDITIEGIKAGEIYSICIHQSMKLNLIIKHILLFIIASKILCLVPMTIFNNIFRKHGNEILF